jgi:hypothetical protein
MARKERKQAGNPKYESDSELDVSGDKKWVNRSTKTESVKMIIWSMIFLQIIWNSL